MAAATPEAQTLSAAWTALDAAVSRVRSSHLHEISDAMEDLTTKCDFFRAAHAAWQAKMA